jgi:hypothetical protein
MLQSKTLALMRNKINKRYYMKSFLLNLFTIIHPFYETKTYPKSHC